MISQKLHKIISHNVKLLQHFTERFWFPPLIGFLAALDNFIIIIPNDGILISSSMLTPKRWFFLALSVSVGSTVGAIALAYLVAAIRTCLKCGLPSTKRFPLKVLRF